MRPVLKQERRGEREKTRERKEEGDSNSIGGEEKGGQDREESLESTTVHHT
jgi:hypothetical protein